jgi:iron(II)-dependent oxidoreductase
MAIIPAGDFVMGSDRGKKHEQPPKWVYLDAYEIDRFEVTQAQYQQFLQSSGREPPIYWKGGNYPPGTASRPVVGVSWPDAQGYCEWAGKRLPTEAEWEKACRGREGKIFPWGDDWSEGKANLGAIQAENWPLDLEEGWEILQLTPDRPDLPGLQPVGSYLNGISDYGVFDLAGNASEWVADWYNWDGYEELPRRNPIGLGPPWNHSVRGSGWFDRRGMQALIMDSSRCSARNSSHSDADPRLGFRCARSRTAP